MKTNPHECTECTGPVHGDSEGELLACKMRCYILDRVEHMPSRTRVLLWQALHDFAEYARDEAVERYNDAREDRASKRSYR